MRVCSKWKSVNGCWKSELTPGNYEIWVSGNNDLEVLAKGRLSEILNRLEFYIDQAKTFVDESQYKQEVMLKGGIKFQGVFIDSEDRFYIWFEFTKESSRTMSVSVVGGKIRDVFCDH